MPVHKRIEPKRQMRIGRKAAADTQGKANLGISSGSGLHQAFSTPAVSFQPLPIPSLIGVPLVDAATHSKFASVSGRLRHNLLVGAYYRNHHIDLLSGKASYSLTELYANYRIGKVAIDVAYGRYFDVSRQLTGPESSSSLNRFRFRIVRTFDLF